MNRPPAEMVMATGMIIDPQPDDRGQLMMVAVTDQRLVALTGSVN